MDIPKTWRMVPLGELGKWGSGGTPPRSRSELYGGNIPWLKIGDLTDGPIWEAEEAITEAGLENSSAKLLAPGTILLAMYGSIGKIGITKISCATNQAIAFCICDDDLIDQKYLFWGLRHLRPALIALGQGGTQQNISQTLIKQVPLPVAPRCEQRKIVEKIETLFVELDKGEESLRQVQTLLARYRQSVLKAAVTEFTGSSETVRLGELLEDIRYGTAKKCRAEVEGVPVLRIPNVVTGQIELEDLKFAELEEKELSRLSLTRGDVLLVRSNGSANLVGRTAVVDDRAAGMAFAGYLIRLRVDRNRILPEFLHIVLNSPEVREKIERQARSTSGVHNINSTEVRAIEFELPTVATQSEIVEQVGEQVANADLLEAACIAELSRSAALRQSILKDAFSGRLVPQDSNDEPASELLARIRQSRNPDQGRSGRKQSAAGT